MKKITMNLLKTIKLIHYIVIANNYALNRKRVISDRCRLRYFGRIKRRLEK